MFGNGFSIFESFIIIQERDIWRFIFRTGSACLSEASFRPWNINLHILCLELNKTIKMLKLLLNIPRRQIRMPRQPIYIRNIPPITYSYSRINPISIAVYFFYLVWSARSCFLCRKGDRIWYFLIGTIQDI